MRANGSKIRGLGFFTELERNVRTNKIDILFHNFKRNRCFPRNSISYGTGDILNLMFLVEGFCISFKAFS